MKHSTGYRLGIVNPLTLVGNEIKTILRERSVPFDKVVLLDSTGKAENAITDLGDEAAVVIPATDDELEELDLVFFCGPAAVNGEWIERSAEDKFIVLDLSQPTTTDNGKLAVAGVNLDAIDAGDDVLVSPHPVAIPMAILLHQIAQLSPIELCTATVIQPASHFEQEGVEELAQQTISVLNAHGIPHQVFDRQLAFNLYPALERTEDFIVSQIKSLTDPRTAIALFVTQGTIFHGHTFSLFIKTQEEFESDAIREALGRNPAVAFAEGDQQFGTIDAAGRDEVLVADVRPDPSIRGGFWVWAACDNLRRSSALNAVLVAEKVLFGSGAAN